MLNSHTLSTPLSSANKVKTKDKKKLQQHKVGHVATQYLFTFQAGVNHKIDVRIAPAQDTLSEYLGHGISHTFTLTH